MIFKCQLLDFRNQICEKKTLLFWYIHKIQYHRIGYSTDDKRRNFIYIGVYHEQTVDFHPIEMKDEVIISQELRLDF